MANETMKAATRRSEDDVMISGDGKAKKGSKRIFRTIRHFFRRKSGKHADDEDGSSGIEQSPEWPQSGRRTSDAMEPGYPSPNRDDKESPSSGAPFPISRLSMSHDSVFSPDPQVTSPLHRASVSSLDASSSSLNAKALGMRAISVVRNRDGRSEGSLLSMGSSEHDEDSGFGQTSRHSSKLSLAEKKSQDGLDWDLGEPPLGAAPLSHSAARHKMAVRPRRTMAGPTRHRRLQQLSASVLPSMPEMNEDAASGSSSMTITKSQSETMHFMSSSSNAASSVTVAASSSSTTTKVSSTASTSVSNYTRRDKMTRASIRPTTPSPTHSPSTKLSRSKSTGADRKIRHEVERFESSKRIDFDPKSTPSRYLSPPRRKPEDDDQQLQASSTSVNSAQGAGRESRRRDLRRIKKDKEEKKNASNSASSSKSPPGDDSNNAASAGNHGVAGNTFFSRLFGSRRSYKKKKDEGKHSDGHAATDDDDDDGGFSPHSRDKKNPAASSVSPVRRMDPKGGYAQDADAKFLSPDAYARDAEVNVSPPSIIAGKNPLFKFPLRSNRSNMLPSVSQDENIGGNVVLKGKSSSDKGEDSVVIQPDVIRKTLLDPLKDPQRPNFLLGSAVTASQPPSGQGLIPPKPARSSLPFGRPSLHHHGNQQPGHSPKPPRIEGLSRFQKKVLLVEDENDEEHVEETHRISKSAATTPDDDRERLPNILRQARSFRQTNSASNSECNLKRLSQQPQSSSQELLKDELEVKWQMRKSNASYERIDSKESASTGVQIREKKDAPTDENTENRRRSLFGEILRPTGFFERSHSPVNGNIETGPMSLDSVLTTRTEDSGGGGLTGAGDDYSSNTGSSLNSTGPVSLMVIPPSRPSVVNNKRPLVTLRSSGVPIGGRKPNVVDDDDLYDDEDDDAVREPPLKPKLWDCKIRKFERNAPTSSSGSSTSSASSSSTSTSSCSVGRTPPPASNLMETDLDDDVVEANPIVASFARPSFMAGSGTATTRPRNVPAPAEPESPAPKTVIKIGELRKNSASKIPVLASSSVPASASLVAAVSKSSSSDEDTPVKMRNKPKPIPNIPVAPTNNGEGGFSRASLRPSGSANPDQLAANELLKVFQRRSLKAKDAETLQAQVVEMLEKEKPGNISPPVQEDKPPSPSAFSAKPVAPPVEKPKLTASKSLGMALSGPSHGTNNNSNSVANANLNAAKPTPTGSPPSGQSDGIPEWKRIAQQRKEKREQLEQLSVRGDGEGENAARNAAARSSKVLDLVNNFQKRSTDLPTTTNL